MKKDFPFKLKDSSFKMENSVPLAVPLVYTILLDPSPCLFEQIGQNLASVPFKKRGRKKQCKKRASIPL